MNEEVLLADIRKALEERQAECANMMVNGSWRNEVEARALVARIAAYADAIRTAAECYRKLFETREKANGKSAVESRPAY